jgi:hypothetical protein
MAQTNSLTSSGVSQGSALNVEGSIIVSNHTPPSVPAQPLPPTSRMHLAKKSGLWAGFGFVVTRLFLFPSHPLAGGVCSALIHLISNYTLPIFESFYTDEQSCRSHNALLNLEIVVIAGLSCSISCRLGFPIGFGPAIVLTIPQFLFK